MDHPADSYREREVCPLYTAIGVVSGRWKPMILQRLGSRPIGFGELQRAMPRVTAKVLRGQLRQLQGDNHLARSDARGTRIAPPAAASTGLR